MKLTKKALTELKNNKTARTRLALAFNKTDFSVLRWIKENADNGFLTTAKALQIIGEELQLADTQILETQAA